jgi:hypothetical protein
MEQPKAGAFLAMQIFMRRMRMHFAMHLLMVI